MYECKISHHVILKTHPYAEDIAEIFFLSDPKPLKVFFDWFCAEFPLIGVQPVKVYSE